MRAGSSVKRQPNDMERELGMIYTVKSDFVQSLTGVDFFQGVTENNLGFQGEFGAVKIVRLQRGLEWWLGKLKLSHKSIWALNKPCLTFRSLEKRSNTFWSLTTPYTCVF